MASARFSRRARRATFKRTGSALAGLVAASSTLFAPHAGAQSFALAKGGYPLEFYDIDFSGLSDPARRVNLLDEIHYIPVPLSPSAYLSLGAEVRQQAWWRDNDSHGLRAPNQNSYDLSRAVGYAYLHFDRHVAAFVELGRYDAWSKINPSTTDKGRGRVQQGFFELREDAGATALTGRLGRQEIMLGSGRFVWVNDSSNIRTTHDGVRVHAQYQALSLDLVASEPTTPTISSFSDWNSHNGSFAAAYASEAFAGRRAHIDEYYYFRKNIGGQYAGLTGNEDRHTLGTRLWGQSASGAFLYDGEAAYQFGHFDPGARVISAVGATVRTLYSLQTVAWTPGLQLQASYFSGSSNKTTIRTFSAPFPRPTMLNYASLNALENLWEVYPAALVTPAKDLTLRFGPQWLWRASVHDAVYVSRQTPLTRTIAAGDTAAFIGTNLITTAQWKIRPGVILFGEYLHEIPGPAITRAAGKGSDVGVVQLDINL